MTTNCTCWLHRYHVAHICNCPTCNGKVWDHSQGSWDDHLRSIDAGLIVNVAPQDYDCEGKLKGANRAT